MSDTLTTGFVAEAMRAKGYDVRPGPDVPVTGGAADSRNVMPGDLFTAFPGENVDGNDYVPAAIANGAVAVICERAPEDVGDCTVVVAPNATRAVGELAHAWRMECNPKVVGITGTVGKTTAKEMTAAVLAAQFRTHKSEGNFNSREGLPLALMSLRRDHEVSVLEMGMDSAGEIVELCEIARPDVGVVLNIGLTHVSKLGSIEAIAREKLSLARWLPEKATAILNLEDPRIADAAHELRCRVIGFGQAVAHREGRMELTYGEYTSERLAGSRFWVSAGPNSNYRVDSPLPGEHTVPAVLTALCAGMALGMRLVDACNAVGKTNVSGRSRTLAGINGSTVIDDRYNASPASVAGALRLLRENRNGTRIALLGKMAELGDFEREEHKRMGTMAKTCADILASFGPLGRIIIDAAVVAGMTDAHWFETKEEASAYVASRATEGSTILVKGSRSEALETILPLLEAKP
ncbi:hypothetical protein AYO38_01645 [bacterium SCGC AG-212-C10]|nr:hypothetical protein AYO38_01645 [bacterium SCGC AG-212-C10]